MLLPLVLEVRVLSGALTIRSDYKLNYGRAKENLFAMVEIQPDSKRQTVEVTWTVKTVHDILVPPGTTALEVIERSQETYLQVIPGRSKHYEPKLVQISEVVVQGGQEEITKGQLRGKVQVRDETGEIIGSQG